MIGLLVNRKLSEPHIKLGVHPVRNITLLLVGEARTNVRILLRNNMQPKMHQGGKVKTSHCSYAK